MQVNRLLIPLLVLSMVFAGAGRHADDEMVSYVVDPARQEVQFYWKDDKGDALYLDGFVSRPYLPEKQWEQTDGNLGVIIGVTVPE